MSRHTIILRGNAERAREKDCVHCGLPFVKDPRNTWAYWRRAKYCSQRCAGEANSAAIALAREPLAAVFARWFEKTDGCWEWKGARDKDGYGIFSYAGQSFRAAKVSLELDGRGPGNGMLACHKCDNPPCVRPDHLYCGTPTENVSDALSRGRMKRVKRAKLTIEQVREIRRAHGTHSQIGARFGVSGSNVTMIRNRTTWADVE